MPATAEHMLSERYIEPFEQYLKNHGYVVNRRKIGFQRMSYKNKLKPEIQAKGEIPSDDAHVFIFKGTAADEVVAFLDTVNGNGRGVDLRPSWEHAAQLADMKVSIAHCNGQLCLQVVIPPEESERLAGGKLTKPFKLRADGSLREGTVSISADPFKGLAVHHSRGTKQDPRPSIRFYWPADRLGGAQHATDLLEVPQEECWKFVQGPGFTRVLMLRNLPKPMRQAADYAPPPTPEKKTEITPPDAADNGRAEAEKIFQRPPEKVEPEVAAAVGSPVEPKAPEGVAAAPTPPPAMIVPEMAHITADEIDFQALGELKEAVAMLNEARLKVPVARLVVNSEGQVKVFIPPISL